MPDGAISPAVFQVDSEDNVQPNRRRESFATRYDRKYAKQGSVLLDEGKKATVPQQIVIFILVLVFGLLFLYIFSALPYCLGGSFYSALDAHYNLFSYIFGCSAALAVILYVLDVRFWSGRWHYVGLCLIVITVLGFCVSMLFATEAYVIAPIAVFLFGAPIVLLSLKVTLFRKMDLLDLLNVLGISLWFVFAASSTLWLVWIIVSDHWWNLSTKVVFYEKMTCNSSGVDLETLTSDYIANLTSDEYSEINETLVTCTSAFLLWLLPLVLALWAFTFAGMLYFVARAVRTSRIADSETKALDPLAQAFLMFVSLGLLGIYAASGIAGAQMALTNIVLALGFLALVVAGIVVVAVFGWSDILGALEGTPLGNRMLAFINSDWVKAMMLMLTTPLMLIYFFLSIITQTNRKLWSCTKPLEPEHRKYIMTANATSMWRSVLAWEWSSVLIKTLWIGILFFLFAVGVTRITTLFLSWLNGVLSSVSLLITTFIFIAVGIVMFLLPPVPGVPVYVAGGIILVSSATDLLTFWGGVAYTMGICYMLKMIAIVIQQKVFGEYMASRSVWVRSFIGVNSVEMRAIRRILQAPGMTWPKVSVLCGGPDWPTSVTTGILRLNLGSMLLGSQPVFFLIAPCVLAGAMLLRSSEGGIWSSVSTMTLALAVITQSAAMLIAVHFIAKVSVEDREELLKEKDDEEVLELEIKSRNKLYLHRTISSWKHIGWFNRILLASSSLCMTVSCYMFELLGSECFVSFEVSDSIEDDLGGNALNLVKPLGWYALLLFAYSTCVLFIYNFFMNQVVSYAFKRPNHWAHAEAKERLEADIAADKVRASPSEEGKIGEPIQA